MLLDVLRCRIPSRSIAAAVAWTRAVSYFAARMATFCAEAWRCGTAACVPWAWSWVHWMCRWSHFMLTVCLSVFAGGAQLC